VTDLVTKGFSLLMLCSKKESGHVALAVATFVVPRKVVKHVR